MKNTAKMYQGKIANNTKVAKAIYARIDREVKAEQKRRQYAKTLAAAIVASLTATGCTSFGASQMFSDSDEGFVMVAGNAEGIRAYNDGLIGIITDTKSSPDVKSAYWQNREAETSVRTMRLTPRRSWTQQQKDGSRY